jgi:hypothetical protein
VIAGVVGLGAVARMLSARTTRRKNLVETIRAQWGKAPDRKNTGRDIALFHDLKVEADQSWHTDDLTWEDLYMQEIFERVDHCRSRIGSQVLYDLLRTPSFQAEEIATRSRLIALLGADPELRVQAQAALQALETEDAGLLPNLFFTEMPARPAAYLLYPALTAAVLGAVVVTAVHHQAWTLFIPLILTNIFVSQAYREKIQPWIQPLRVLNTLVRTADRLHRLVEAKADPDLNEVLRPYREHRPAALVLEGLTRWLMIERNNSGSDLGSIFVEYLNMVLLLDVNSFLFSMEAIRSRERLIRVLFEMVGTLDALLAVASYRHSLVTYCVPTFGLSEKRLTIDDALHPLLANGVPNSLAVEGKGIFVTGSNMSGKTTFIRTIAVNALLAQTIATCTARRYEAPLLEVHTSIGRTDSLQEGKSYYMSEVEAIGGFIEDAAEAAPCLFVIDEIFRGTNTTERIAASKAVLDALNRTDGPHLVMVSTHDIDLARLLQTFWDRYHFREYVEDGALQFDFKLRPGLSSSRNALRLLAACGYPEAVVADAEATAARIDLEPRPGLGPPIGDSGDPV